jgi:hypothetical protein
MPFEWLNQFHGTVKSENYSEKALAAYRLGMRSGGAIVGVVVQTGAECCDAARALTAGAVYSLDEAPRLPLSRCTDRDHCWCTYRPRMTYQEEPK